METFCTFLPLFVIDILVLFDFVVWVVLAFRRVEMVVQLYLSTSDGCIHQQPSGICQKSIDTTKSNPSQNHIISEHCTILQSNRSVVGTSLSISPSVHLQIQTYWSYLRLPRQARANTSDRSQSSSN